jgi:predicted RecA/RadA family phage recombinase
MNKATFYQRGETLDYTNATNKTIEAMSIISLGSIIGVAGTDIEPNAVGTVHVTGVFAMPKTDEEAVTIGTNVYFDGKGITVAEKTEDTENILAGYAASDTKATDTTILVKLRG